MMGNPGFNSSALGTSNLFSWIPSLTLHTALKNIWSIKATSIFIFSCTVNIPFKNVVHWFDYLQILEPKLFRYAHKLEVQRTDGILNHPSPLPHLYSVSYYQLSEELARTYPELTISIFSGIFYLLHLQ